MGFSSSMVLWMCLYSCLFRMCTAYANWGSLFFICDLFIVSLFQVSFGLFDVWQVLHVGLYIPLLSCSGIVLSVFVRVSCWSVLVFLNAIFIFVFLNRFMIFLFVDCDMLRSSMFCLCCCHWIFAGWFCYDVFVDLIYIVHLAESCSLQSVVLIPILFVFSRLFIYIYTHTHTHTHTKYCGDTHKSITRKRPL
jgi:hypothetical protein